MNEPIIPPISLLTIKFVFDEIYYTKYDVFKLGNTKYICISEPKESKNSKWLIEALPTDILPVKDKYNTEFIENKLSELYS